MGIFDNATLLANFSSDFMPKGITVWPFNYQSFVISRSRNQFHGPPPPPKLFRIFNLEGGKIGGADQGP
jgi:hypothetical protein